jgi:hypothetical protein
MALCKTPGSVEWTERERQQGMRLEEEARAQQTLFPCEPTPIPDDEETRWPRQRS